MHLLIGNTKLSVGKYSIKEIEHIEINFEYLFDSSNSYRRFANVLVNSESGELKIKIKSEFKNITDCEKLAQLIIGIQKIIVPKNISILDEILKEDSAIEPDDFLKRQKPITNYFL